MLSSDSAKSRHHGPLGSPIWVRCSLAAADRVAPKQTAHLMSQRLFRLPSGPETRLRRPAPPGAREFTWPHNGSNIWGWELGTGDKHLYVVHGWAGCAGDMEHIAIAAAQAGFHVIATDGPSHGNSGPSMRGERYSSFTEMASGIRTAMEKFGDPYAVAAHSMGAINVTYAMRQLGVKPRRMALFAPFLGGDSFRRGISEGIGVGPATMKHLRPLAERQLGTAPDEASLVDNPLDVPTWVIHDVGDRAHPWENSQKLADTWPHVSLNLSSGLGHRKILRESGSVNEAVSFLSRA